MGRGSHIKLQTFATAPHVGRSQVNTCRVAALIYFRPDVTLQPPRFEALECHVVIMCGIGRDVNRWMDIFKGAMLQQEFPCLFRALD